MAKEFMLTTNDNPFDPFEQFDSWFMFDVEKGYYSCSKLARLLDEHGISLFDGLSQQEIENATEQIIDNFVKHDFTDTFIKATHTTED